VRARYVAETGVQSLGGQENQWIIAEALHQLGRYQEASAVYAALLEQPEPLVPRTRLSFRKALADTGIAMSDDIATPERDRQSALLDRLLAAEAALARDGWSHKLERRVVFLQYLLGRADLDRLARMADDVDLGWSAEGEHDKLVHGSVLFMAEETMRAAGRVDHADALALKLRRFDEVFGTSYGSGDHGDHHGDY
jgi:hypothetical protein